MVREDPWSAMFSTAFKRSRNAMVLLDDRRRQVEVNGAYLRLLGYSRKAVIGEPIYHFVVGGPLVTPERWAELLTLSDFTGEVSMISADGSHVAIQWGAHTELVTGRRLVLFVALSTSRWGQRFRRSASTGADPGQLSEREREIVRLVAEGRTGPEIADELQIAHDTVRTHVRNAMTKAGARSRAHLVAKALGEGHVFS